tara:strand:- start:69 stop:257 length:189 start_codon:yes stop_codon:yes gene_type:complete
MLIIKVKGKKIEYVLKDYRQKVDNTGTLKELRSRKRFKKKSQKRREQLGKAKYIQKKYGNNR